MKFLLIALSIFSLYAFANQPVLGRLIISHDQKAVLNPAETIPPQVLPPELNDRFVPLTLFEFTPSSVEFLRKFAGAMGEIFVERGRMVEARFSGRSSSISIDKNGAKIVGRINLNADKTYIEFASGKQRRSLRLKGPILDYRHFENIAGSGNVIVEGILRDDGNSLQVQRIELVDRHQGHRIVVVSGILFSGPLSNTDKTGYYVEGRDGSQIWYNPSDGAGHIASLLGFNVLIEGKYDSGEIYKGTIRPVELNEDSDCSVLLMTEILQNHQSHKAAQKKKK